MVSDTWVNEYVDGPATCGHGAPHLTLQAAVDANRVALAHGHEALRIRHQHADGTIEILDSDGQLR